MNILLKLYSTVVGGIARIPIPVQYREQVWRFIGMKFLKMKEVDFDEIKKPLKSFKNFYEFFTREIKITKRPLSKGKLVSPADCKLLDYGKITKTKKLKIKGTTYTLQELCRDDDLGIYSGGFYVNLYLAPYNYHRFHAPLGATVKKIAFIDGELYPVNDWGINNIDKLYSKNKRAVIDLELKKGVIIKFIAVGATAVGDIKFLVSEGDKVRKGQCIGYFGLGSTIILALPNGFDGKLTKRRGAILKARELLLNN